jgi:hypothetical protein
MGSALFDLVAHMGHLASDGRWQVSCLELRSVGKRGRKNKITRGSPRLPSAGPPLAPEHVPPAAEAPSWPCAPLLQPASPPTPSLLLLATRILLLSPLLPSFPRTARALTNIDGSLLADDLGTQRVETLNVDLHLFDEREGSEPRSGSLESCGGSLVVGRVLGRVDGLRLRKWGGRGCHWCVVGGQSQAEGGFSRLTATRSISSEWTGGTGGAGRVLNN